MLRAGGLALVRAFGATAAGGVALVAVAQGVPLPAVPAGIVSVVAYVGVLGLVEFAAHRADVFSYVRALPLRRPHAEAVE
jgi:hypothetical protein